MSVVNKPLSWTSTNAHVLRVEGYSTQHATRHTDRPTVRKTGGAFASWISGDCGEEDANCSGEKFKLNATFTQINPH